ncbi:hypothetical protein C0993_007835 [Termitomyces sp. T159_Od127]|nr:hypothetical protein C0993_007835 [Termitomyces sp. T159_Od127]
MEQRCISVSTSSSGSHVLHLADGTTYEADVIIGADGIKSVIREFVSGQATSLAYSNSVAYRSVVPSERFKTVKVDMMRPLCWIGKDNVSKVRLIMMSSWLSDRLAHYNIPRSSKAEAVLNTGKMNLVCFSTDSTIPIGSVNVPLPWAKPASQDELFNEFSQADWGEDSGTILKEMKNPSKWYLHFLSPPLSTYTRQRVVLVGDADVLKAYDTIRVGRANMVHKMSMITGDVYEMRGPGGGTIPQIQEQLRDMYHPIWHYDLKEEVEHAVAGVHGPGGIL